MTSEAHIAGDERSALEIARAVRPVLDAHAAAVDRDVESSGAGLAKLRESGLMGLLVPREYGGLGGDLGTVVAVAQELAAGCLSTAMIWAMHCQQVDALVRHASPGLQDRLLPRIALGEVYVASVTTEPGNQRHLLNADAPISENGEELLFAREAPVVTGGEYADGFLITMRAAPNAAPQQVTLIYADREQLDIRTKTGWDSLGMRGTHSVGMHLNGAIPADQVVGGPGRFRDVAVDSMIVAGHLAWSACWLGCGRAALSEVVGLIRSPARPRGLDPDSELVRERLARSRMDLELVGAYLHRVRDEVLSRRSFGLPVDDPARKIHLNTLKVTAAELTFQAVDRLLQLCGLSVGYMRGSSVPLERHFRDLRSASLNYANDRLLDATGTLLLADRLVELA